MAERSMGEADQVGDYDYERQRPEWDGEDLGLPEPEEDVLGRPL